MVIHELKNYTLAIAGCGEAIFIYEGFRKLAEIPKDLSHWELTDNDYGLAKQVFSSIKDLEKRRFNKRIKAITTTIEKLQAVA